MEFVNVTVSDWAENGTVEEDRASFTGRVHLFLLPLFIVVGIVGNSMAILLVRTHNSLKRLPSNAYLGVLAGSSVVFLLVLAYQWVESVTGWNFWNRKPFLCKTFSWLGHCCDFASAWLVVVLSIERAVVLFRFHHRHKFCNALAAQRVIAAVWLVTMSFNSWVFFLANITHPTEEDLALMGVDLEESAGTDELQYCGVLPADEPAYAVMLSLETILGMILPAALITTTNLLLIAKLRYYRRFLPLSPSVRFHRPSKDTNNPTHNVLDSGYPDTQGLNTEVVLSAATTLDTNASSVGGRKRRVRPSDLRLTRTLLLITSLFIGLNLPIYIFRCLDQFAPHLTTPAYAPLIISENATLKEQREAIMQQAAEDMTTTWLELVKLFAYLLSYGHHALLFYVYIFYSPQMKKQLRPMAMKLLECDCLRPVPGLDMDSV